MKYDKIMLQRKRGSAYMKLETRTIKARKLRDKEVVAGVLYGSGFDTVSISAQTNDFLKTYYTYGTSKTFEATLEGKKHIVYIKEVMKDNMKDGVYKHFDLIKVSKDDKLVSKVRVLYLNKEVVKKKGLIINPILDEVEIEYNVGAGVSNVEVDIQELDENGVIKVKDIIAIEGVKVLNDPEDSLVSASFPKEEVEVDEDVQEGYAPEEVEDEE